MSRGQDNKIIVNDREHKELVRLFKALSDSSRLKIIFTLLSSGPLCVTDIADRQEMSVSSVSHHLNLLETMDFLRRERNGKRVFYYISDECLPEILKRACEHVTGK